MPIINDKMNVRSAKDYGGRFYGVYSALVTDIVDPDRQGRVRVELPWSPDHDDASYQAWARLATMMAGANRGTWFVPDVGDEVLVVFESGDTRRPNVIGGLWNGVDAPPEEMDSAGENNRKTIRSRSGVTVTFDDTEGSEQLLLSTPAGHSITLDDGGMKITLEDSSGNTVEINSSGITINATAKVNVNASTVEVSASMLEVNAGMSKFSGVIQADTVITNSVVASSYTPGTGNLW